MSKQQDFSLVVEIDAKRYTVSGSERAKMEVDIGHLRRQVERFPVAELKVEITPHARPSGVSVKTSLLLPGTTLVAADSDTIAHPAFQRCIRKLVDQLKAFKEELSHKPDYEKHIQGTLHEVGPTQEPDLELIESAVAAGDYAAFSHAMNIYQDALSTRAGRLIERWPAAARQVGDQLMISQVVEEVLLLAFDRFSQRPRVRLGQWLEELIEPATRALVENHGDERQNLSFIESAKDVL